MHQYVIFYRRVGMPSFVQLKPLENMNLYEREQVRHAVDHMRRNAFVNGVCVQVDDELYNVMSFSQESKAPNAFGFEDNLSINEPIDQMAVLQAAGLEGYTDCSADADISGNSSEEPDITATSKDGKTTLRLVR